jgi:hypothetical protein
MDDIERFSGKPRKAIERYDKLARQLRRAGYVKLSVTRRGPRGKRGRKPPEAGLPVPAIPPGGPLPLQGGAEARLEFDE